ncbi:MAG TPA: hypothetical protein VFG68_19970 [Fimbriiglobus sp.]|nr:hypothetical protein [Fimbriiglobus sp.]
MFPLTRAAWFAAALVVIVPAAGRAQPTRIALSGVTPAPGTGVFSSFDRAPAMADGLVTFRGLYPGGEGIYIRAGGAPLLIANSATSAPGGGNFGVFGPPVNAGPTVVFAGGQAPGAPPNIPSRGVYSNEIGFMRKVADTTTASPSNGLPFGGFSAMPAASGTGGGVQYVAFFAGNSGAGGIYTSTGSGPVLRVADTTTAMPGIGGMFFNFIPPDVYGGRVAFIGGNPGGIGVYTAQWTGGALTTIATTNTTIPGSTLPFRQLGGDPSAGPANAPGPSIFGAVVAFAGSPNPSGPSLGVYATTGPGGQLARIADTSTPVPNNPALLFTQFDPQVSLAGDDVAFIGRSGVGPGLYTNATGSLTKLVAAGDTFDGLTVADLGIGKHSFDGAFVTFWAGFTNGSSGIYVVPVAPVPEPAGVLAAVAVGVGLLRLRRVRRGRATSCGPQAAS